MEAHPHGVSNTPMSKIDTIVKAHALVSATIERKTPDAFAVLKEAASRSRDLALGAKRDGVSQEIVDTARDIAKSLSVLAAAHDSLTVEGEARELSEEQFHAYVGKQVAAALASTDPLVEIQMLTTLKAALAHATSDKSEEIRLVFSGEVEGSATFADVTKAVEDASRPTFTHWPADLARR